MRKNQWAFVFVTVWAIILMIAPSAGAAPKVIKFGHYSVANLTLPGDGLVAKTIVMKDYIESESGGSLKMEVFPNAQLGSVRPMVELTQRGVIQMTVCYASILGTFVPEAEVILIPFLFKDALAGLRALNGPLGDELADLCLKKTGTRILNWPEGSGFRNVYTRDKVIKSPQDFQGLKIRVPESSGLLAFFKSMGAIPKTVTWTETYTALQTGVADALEPELGATYSNRMFEIMKTCTLLRHAWGTTPILMNEKFFQSLTPKEKMIVARGIEMGSLAENGFNRSAEIMIIEKQKKEGVTFYSPNENEMEQFRKIGQKAYLDDMSKRVSQQWIDKAFNAAAKAEEDIAKGYQAKIK